MEKKEQALTIKLQRYFKNKMSPSFFWEAKYVRTTNYAFRSDKSFQKELMGMLHGECNGICHKFSDIAALGTMFDGFYIKAPGYFFIYYEKSKRTYMIPAKRMEGIVESEHRSLSETTACLLYTSDAADE